MRTRIKICGITRIEDGLDAASAGADAIGFVFYAKSPRYVAPAQARVIADRLPPFVTSVGLFVDATPAEVRDVIRVARLDCLQFHGDESPDYCASFSIPFMKAARVRPGQDLLQYSIDFRDAQALLLDAYVEGVPGGTGQRFDWRLIPQSLSLPIVLSGGLDADNVSDAIAQVRPWAVDVSSGVEASKGIKDAKKIEQFIRGVRNADV